MYLHRAEEGKIVEITLADPDETGGLFPLEDGDAVTLEIESDGKGSELIIEDMSVYSKPLSVVRYITTGVETRLQDVADRRYRIRVTRPGLSITTDWGLFGID